jgi:hypothetical protein
MSALYAERRGQCLSADDNTLFLGYVRRFAFVVKQPVAHPLTPPRQQAALHEADLS